MPLLIRMVTLVLAFQTVTLTSSIAQTNDPDVYPDLPMAKIYRDLANGMTERLIQQIPEAREHKTQILAFIFSRMPVNSFERLMTVDSEPLKNGKKSAGACSPEQLDPSGCNSLPQ